MFKDKRHRLQVFFWACVLIEPLLRFVGAFLGHGTPKDEVLAALSQIDGSIRITGWWIIAAIIAMRIDATDKE